MTCSGVKNRLVSRPNPYHLPEWPLPLFPRSCGESLSMCDCETHDGRETFVQINWCVEGEGVVSIAHGTEHVVTPGDVFYSLPGEARKNTGRSAPWRLRWLTFDGPFAADFIRAYAYPVFLQNAGRCPEELFLEFERGLRENTLSAMRRLISLIAEILFLAADPLNGAAPENRLIRRFVEIVREQYPKIKFITKEEAEKINSYANYNIGLWELGNTTHQPLDHRYIGLHKIAAQILGVGTEEIPPRFNLSAPRIIPEKYVCIAVQSTSLAKMWNNPIGWRAVVDFLKQKGYRVLCIDQAPFTGKAGTYTYLPPNAEDFTGNKPLQERIDLIKDADFFIGLSSGLSWLAWGCKVPVVLISGFTAPWNEFHTPYRIINYNVCNSCWNDFKDFDLSNYWHCPRQENTERKFECSAMISPDHVIDVITALIQDRFPDTI